MDSVGPDVDVVMAAYHSEIEKVLGPCIVGDFVVLAEVTPASGDTILSSLTSDVKSWREIGMITRRLQMLALDPPDEEFGSK